jgi:ABC-type transport system substrate-binding protein
MKGLAARRAVALVVVVVTLSFTSVVPAAAEPKVLQFQNTTGQFDFLGEGPAPFTLTGAATHLGKFTAYGESEFVPGDAEGSLIGEGVIVFEAANGDLLVGAVTWEIDGGSGETSGGRIHVSWRDEVTFSDGTTAATTGRFVDNRPPGVSATIEYIICCLLLIIVGR